MLPSPGGILKKGMGTVMVFLLCSAFAASAGATVTPSGLPDPVTLNSYSGWHRPYTRPATTDEPLTAGEYYVATVSGTISYYPAYLYRPHTGGWNALCGTPVRTADGPTGMDAQFVFARPWTRRGCAHHHFPTLWPNFRVSTAHFSHWLHPPILQPVTQPDADHTYSYAILGAGAPAAFRLNDRKPQDNYGSLTIDLRLATSADCGAYQSFGFVTSTACLAALSLQ